MRQQIAAILLLAGFALAQAPAPLPVIYPTAPAGKVVCRDGYVKIFSKTAMEDINAETKSAVSIFEPQTGHLRVRIQITSFVFPNHLMQEHFNENYMESDKFPMSIFEGVATGIDWDKLSSTGVSPAVVKGDLEIHGTKKAYSVPGTFKKAADGTFQGEAVFKVKIADHDIKVPSIVSKNIADSIEITLHLQGKIEGAK